MESTAEDGCWAGEEPASLQEGGSRQSSLDGSFGIEDSDWEGLDNGSISGSDYDEEEPKQEFSHDMVRRSHCLHNALHNNACHLNCGLAYDPIATAHDAKQVDCFADHCCGICHDYFVLRHI